ncbi:hypothetical protein MUK42_24750 [Musa troglodytarum]|uniref:Uncharacterized protein n=1 Tax=Musa troglodytarum TaxID=320322 RepID=A0A9E7EZ58_9LILI|nr:hypothetical protein MUK42_24750 [Musa troglodytarum]
MQTASVQNRLRIRGCRSAASSRATERDSPPLFKNKSRKGSPNLLFVRARGETPSSLCVQNRGESGALLVRPRGRSPAATVKSPKEKQIHRPVLRAQNSLALFDSAFRG